MSENILIKKVQDNFGAKVETSECCGQVIHLLKDKNDLNDVFRFLLGDSDLQFNYLSDVIGVDRGLEEEERFEFVYSLYSISKKHRIIIKVRTKDNETVPSVTSYFESANWYEREAYDMFGIKFENHPDMRRIYMWEGFDGWPLRKDFPLRGYKDEYNPFGEEKK